jgi:hypothetical protein
MAMAHGEGWQEAATRPAAKMQVSAAILRTQHVYCPALVPLGILRGSCAKDVASRVVFVQISVELSIDEWIRDVNRRLSRIDRMIFWLLDDMQKHLRSHLSGFVHDRISRLFGEPAQASTMAEANEQHVSEYRSIAAYSPQCHSARLSATL